MARFKTLTHLFHLLLLLALAGCKSSELPPPEATPEQVVREKAFLRANFLSHPCFVAALERAKTLDEQPPESPAYSVQLLPSALSNDGFDYHLSVRKSDRVATVTRSGGYFGVHQVLGPVSLATCLQPVFGVAG